MSVAELKWMDGKIMKNSDNKYIALCHLSDSMCHFGWHALKTVRPNIDETILAARLSVCLSVCVFLSVCLSVCLLPAMHISETSEAPRYSITVSTNIAPIDRYCPATGCVQSAKSISWKTSGSQYGTPLLAACRKAYF